MKLLFTTISLFLFVAGINAQMPQGNPSGDKTAVPNIGHIYGKILDAAGKPVSDASIMVMQKKMDTVTKR